MFGIDEIESMAHWITQMTTKPMALEPPKDTFFYVKKERKAIYVTNEKNYPMISVI